MRTIILLLCCSFLPVTGQAIENLNLNCERALTEAVQSNLSLNPDEILVRGTMKPHWKTGSTEERAFGVLDEFYARKILPTPSLSYFKLKRGDRLLIYWPNGKVRIHGYYNEIDGSPALYADPELVNEVIPSNQLYGYFHSNLQAVLIRKLGRDQISKLSAVLSPYVSSYEEYQSKPDRYVAINDHLKIEPAYFEEIHQGQFRFKEAGPYYIEPLLVSEEGAIQKLKPLDEIFVLDAQRNIIHREKFGDELAMIHVQDVEALKERLRNGTEMFVLRTVRF